MWFAVVVRTSCGIAVVLHVVPLSIQYTKAELSIRTLERRTVTIMSHESIFC